MVLELLLVLIVIGVILVFFYRQAVKEFRILQTDSLDKALPLLQERVPIVVLPCTGPPNLWTRKDLQQRPALDAMVQPFIARGTSSLVPREGQELATKVGVPVWIEQQFLPIFKQFQWWTPLLTARTEVIVGAQGLRPTFGYCTAIIATEGALQVSIMNEAADPYLPQKWLGKRLSYLTRDEAPLLGQIQFVDVIVRPGSALLLPPHWKVCWESYETPTPALAVWIDIDHPISRIAHKRFYS